MSGLVIRDKNGENISYSGTQFEGLEDLGSRHLCVRTGSGAEDVVKYALTSKPLNDKYKALRMRISDGASGKEAYIAQRYVDSREISIPQSYSSTRTSQYTSVQTFTSKSTTSIATRNNTRSVSQNPVYYGKPYVRIVSGTAVMDRDGNHYWRVTLTHVSSEKFMNNSSGTSFTAYSNTVSFTISKNISNTTIHSNGYSALSYKISMTNSYEVTRTQTSKVSSYTEIYASNVASSSATQTATASRVSEYTSSTSVSSTETFTSHNVDL